MVDRAPSEPRSIMNVISGRLSESSPYNRATATRGPLVYGGNRWVLLIARAAIAGHLPSSRAAWIGVVLG
jgi:hypothetical protein